MMQKIMKFIKDEDGLELVEYAIIGGIIVVATIVIIATIGRQVSTLFTGVSGALGTAGGGN
jgi:pilus assembly protein Flp/PilA